MPRHRVEAIANEFIKRAHGEGRSLTNMQLQKLPYIAHGWGMALTGNELVADPALAFPYGPVYRELYDALKRYGSGKVTHLISQADGAVGGGVSANSQAPIKANLTDNESQLIDAVWDRYKIFHAYQLSEMTHQIDSPWTITVARNGAFSVIENDLIRKHYVELAARRRASA